MANAGDSEPIRYVRGKPDFQGGRQGQPIIPPTAQTGNQSGSGNVVPPQGGSGTAPPQQGQNNGK
jgi:hypothetical protein